MSGSGDFVKVIRPDRKEAPLEAPRPARTAPGMPVAVIRLALFALVIVGIGLALFMLRGR
jgi:hypothetical protein